MILILLAIITAAAMSAFLLHYSSSYHVKFDTLAAVLGLFLTIATGFATITYAFAGWSWFAAEHRARIVNREYGTNYTQEEIFWASNVIDTIRELDRRRIEVNGDIMRDQPDEDRR